VPVEGPAKYASAHTRQTCTSRLLLYGDINPALTPARSLVYKYARSLIV